MKYRTIPNLKWKPSALGFGAMRLPVIDDNQGKVDIPEAVRMIRYAIDQGVNYVDTAYFYHAGNGEQAVGEALKDGYREKIKLATKFPARYVKSSADFDRAFEEQLQRLKTDRIDFYLLHGLNRNGFERLRAMGILPWLEKRVSLGKLGYLGFSFHDDFEVFKQIVDVWNNWSFCQVQFNYMDVDYQAGRRGVEYAASKNLGVMIMEPLRGGQLAKKPPQAVAVAWGSALDVRSQVEWAFRWLWNYPEISLVLSGMSTMEQVLENVDIAARAGKGRLSLEELALIDSVREAYRGVSPIPCTSCRYCMPCPNGVEIPVIFKIYNEMAMYNDPRMARLRYSGGPWGVKAETDAHNCLECGQCGLLCPQNIPIPDWLKKAHEALKRD